jgi:hypothetical protein
LWRSVMLLVFGINPTLDHLRFRIHFRAEVIQEVFSQIEK